MSKFVNEELFENNENEREAIKNAALDEISKLIAYWYEKWDDPKNGVEITGVYSFAVHDKDGECLEGIFNVFPDCNNENLIDAHYDGIIESIK